MPLASLCPETPSRQQWNRLGDAFEPLILGRDASFRRRRSGNYIKGAIVRPGIVSTRSMFREARETRNKPGRRASLRIEFRRFAGLVSSRRASTRVWRIKLRYVRPRLWKIGNSELRSSSAVIAWKRAGLKFPDIYYSAPGMDNNVALVTAPATLHITIHTWCVNNVEIILRRRTLRWMVHFTRYDHPRCLVCPPPPSLPIIKTFRRLCK